MKLVTWNCNMAFRKKMQLIADLKPDIVIVPECEKPDRFQFDLYSQKPSDVLWYGDNPNKGLGVFSFSDYRFKLSDNHNNSFKTILPISVTGGKFDFILFAIWANNRNDKGSQYIEQVWKAIHFYDDLLKKHTILMGDFNSNTIWDKQHKHGSHSSVVKRLSEKGFIASITCFINRNKEKKYIQHFSHTDIKTNLTTLIIALLLTTLLKKLTVLK